MLPLQGRWFDPDICHLTRQQLRHCYQKTSVSEQRLRCSVLLFLLAGLVFVGFWRCLFAKGVCCSSDCLLMNLLCDNNVLVGEQLFCFFDKL